MEDLTDDELVSLTDNARKLSKEAFKTDRSDGSGQPDPEYAGGQGAEEEGSEGKASHGHGDPAAEIDSGLV